MSSDHVIYAKPVTVTEERLKEALAKQAKQKAMKEALDRQILEAERVKQEEARQSKRHRLSREKDGALARDNKHISAASASREDVTNAPEPKHPHVPHREPEVARYTFCINGEEATIVKEAGGRGADSSTPYTIEPTEHPGDLPQPTDAPLTNVGNKVRKPKVAAKRRKRGSAETEALLTPRGAAADDGVKRTASSQARQNATPPKTRDAKLAALAEPKNRRTMATRATKGGAPVYQTNSLPVDTGDYAFDLGVGPTRGLDQGRRGASNGRQGRSGEPTHDTQSLPVDLVYRLGRDRSGGEEVFPGVVANTNRPHPPPLRLGTQRPGQPLGLNRRPSSELKLRRGSSPEVEALIMPATPPPPSAHGEYQTGCLGRDFAMDENFAAQLRAARGKGTADHPSPPSSSRPASNGNLLPTRSGVGYSKDGRKLSPRTPYRPAGGVLPPLSQQRHRGSAESDSIIEMSAVLDGSPAVTTEVPMSADHRRHPPSSSSSSQQLAQAPRGRSVRPPSDKRQTRAPPTPQEVSRLQQQLESREGVVRRLQEKERSWEYQVQRLKAELRDARRKERELAKATGGPTALPARAETAPDAPSPSRPLAGPRRDPSSGRGAANHSRLPARAGGRVVASQESPRKPDFSRAHVFTAEEFRPITAPDLPMHSYVPSSVKAPTNAGAKKQAVAAGRPSAGPPPRSHDEHQKALLGEAVASSSALGVSEDSLKLASLTTRQTTFGLDEDDASIPVPIAFDHLAQFAEAQIITQAQSENLWKFFCQLKGVPVLYDEQGAIQRQRPSGVKERDTHSLDSGADDATNDDEEDEDDEDDGEGERSDGAASAASGGPRDNSFSFRPASPHRETTQSAQRRSDYHQSASPVSAVLAPALREKINRMHAAAAGPRQPEAPSPVPPAVGSNGERGRKRAARLRARTPPNSPPHQPAASLQSRPAALEKGGHAGRVTSSRSPISHSSAGATCDNDDEEDDVTRGESERVDDGSTVSRPQSLSLSKESGHGTHAAPPTASVAHDTFDTSVELYPPSEH